MLKSFDYGEADRILTLLTPLVGKVRVLAKGVRRTKSRKGGHLDLFTRASLVMARGRQLDLITQAETIENFRPMREDLWRSSYAHYVAEMAEAFSAEGLANYPLYVLTVQTLRSLATSDRLAMTVRAFEIQMLSHSGYRPQLQRCLGCDEAINPIVNRFSVKMGGVLCPQCASADSAAPEISVGALKVLRNLQANEAALMAVAHIPDGIAREVERRLQEYIVYRLESRPRSIDVLERLRTESAPV